MQNKEVFIKLSERYNMEQYIKPLEELGFFNAPASSKYHLNYKGGLLEHSLNVFKLMIKLKEIYKIDVTEKDIFLCAFLHDLDKVMKYTPKIINGATIYIWDDWLGLDNGVGSVILAKEIGINLSRDVRIAIVNHMGFWEINNFKEKANSIKRFIYAWDLLTLLRHADEGATFCIEKDKNIKG